MMMMGRVIAVAKVVVQLTKHCLKRIKIADLSLCWKKQILQI